MDTEKKELYVREAEKRAGQYAGEQLELLSEFAKIDCGTGDEEGNAQVIDLMQKVFDRIKGIAVEKRYFEGYGNHVIARIKPERSTGKIIINSHLDTVFHRGDAQKYPFHIEGDYAYGLGIADCKAGFVASAYGIKIAQELGALPQKEIVMIYSCDEEVGSPTGKLLFEEESKGAEMVFVFEPAREENGILTYRKGVASGVIEVSGKAAHAGLKYAEGASATVELAHKIVDLSNRNDPKTGMYYNVGVLEGGKENGIVAERARAEISVSIPDEKSVEKIAEDFSFLESTHYVNGCTTKATYKILFPVMTHTDGNVKLYERVKAAGAAMGLDLPEQSSSGSSDACYFSSYGVPTVCAMGPYMQDIHTVQERLLIPTIKERTQLFAVVLGMM